MSEERNEKENLPVIDERKIISVGNSSAVIMPPKWLKGAGLKEGDRVTVVANDELKIAPSSPKLTERLHKKLEREVKE